jgi:hypothetical protein
MVPLNSSVRQIGIWPEITPSSCAFRYDTAPHTIHIGCGFITSTQQRVVRFGVEQRNL